MSDALRADKVTAAFDLWCAGNACSRCGGGGLDLRITDEGRSCRPCPGCEGSGWQGGRAMAERAIKRWDHIRRTGREAGP